MTSQFNSLLQLSTMNHKRFVNCYIMLSLACFSSCKHTTVCRKFDLQSNKLVQLTNKCQKQTLILQQKGFKGDKGEPGSAGSQGLKGFKGEKGNPSNQTELEELQKLLEDTVSNAKSNLEESLTAISKNVNSLNEKLKILESTTENIQSQPASCLQLRNQKIYNKTNNGIYYITNNNNIKFPVYCDMNVDGGGWTLAASVHENNFRSSGRCSVGDKWSSESGNEIGSQVGAEAWSNRDTFGSVVSATSQDYKNPAYYNLQARDVMIWQVPNDTPLDRYYNKSYLRYYTTNGFLTQNGGNMFHLYKDHYPIKSGVYKPFTDNGPAIPVTFDKGNEAEVLELFGSKTQNEITPGYIQFRAINKEKNAFALCPGIKRNGNGYNSEHSCIGSTADNDHKVYCGDFASFNDLTGSGWNVDPIALKTTYFIFYR